MADAAFWFLCGSALTWIAMSLRRDSCWREFNTRRRGSNPPPPGRKPAPPTGPPEQPLTAQLIRYWAWEQEQVRRAWSDPRLGEPWHEEPRPQGGTPNPLPPAPGMRREWLWSPSQMAECGGPCWEAQDPRCCNCGALWRDVPAMHAKPQPHGGRLIKSWEEPLPPSEP